VIGIFVLLTFGQILAQDKLPQPPDPKTIFVPSVDVIETLPQLSYDNKARTIDYYNPALADWKSYSYPAEMKDDIISYYEYTKDKYLLLIQLTDWYKDYRNYRDIGAEYFWIFDAVSGLFSRPNRECGLVQSPVGSGRWVIVTAQSGTAFCNTETGKTTNPLPKTFNVDLQCLSSLWGGQLPLSPDSKWLMFPDCPPDITIYSYEFETGNIHQLGVLTDTDNVGVNGWFEDKNIILYTYKKSLSSLPSVYIADITQPDSLTYIADYPIFNNSKFYWNEFKEDTQAASTSLEIHAYDVRTRARSEVLKSVCGKTPKDCVSGLTIVNKANTRVAIVDYQSVTTRKGLLVYDLVTQNLIYESKAQILSELQILWADDNTLIYFDGFDGYKTNLHIVKFDSNGMSDDLIENGVHAAPVNSVLSPDGTFLILSSADGVEIKVVSTGKIIPITQSHEQPNQFFAGWDNDKNLIVNMISSNPLLPYSWKIQIPDGLVTE
jgi:hypothetical protein